MQPNWLLAWVLLCIAALPAGAQTAPGAQQAWWVFLDTQLPTLSQQRQVGTGLAAAPLSAQALDRRVQQRIPLDIYDYPLPPHLLLRLEWAGAQVVYASRWLQAAYCRMDAETQERVAQLPFVRALRPAVSLRPAWSGSLEPIEEHGPPKTAYNNPREQLEQLGVAELHRQGYRGQGVLMAVFDDGFENIDSVPAFARLMAEGRVRDQWDYVANRPSVYPKGPHGCRVLSLMAADLGATLTGAAPLADYALYRTENTESETRQEEYNWIAAAERADSLGAQLFTTSLGYSQFDPGVADYQPNDMDGATALITQAADRAATRGILVVNSAGNEGDDPWLRITAPADGDSVVAVGAVNRRREVVSFSSRGPAADGRIKPDVVGPGRSCYVSNQSGDIIQGSGTSYSGPLVVGLCACVWQAYPELSAPQLQRLLLQSADHFTRPDSLNGYGLPNGPRMLELAEAIRANGGLDAQLARNSVLVFPVPATDNLNILVHSRWYGRSLRLELMDLMGRVVRSLPFRPTPQEPLFRFARQQWPGASTGGQYVVRLRDAENGLPLHTQSVLLLQQP